MRKRLIVDVVSPNGPRRYWRYESSVVAGTILTYYIWPFIITARIITARIPIAPIQKEKAHAGVDEEERG